MYNYHRFQMTYGDRAMTALPYAMNSEFSKVLAAQMVSRMAHFHQISESIPYMMSRPAT